MEYKTKNLHFATYLCASGVVLKNIELAEHPDTEVVTFVLDIPISIDIKYLEAEWDKPSTDSVRKLLRQYKTLKWELFKFNKNYVKN